MSMCSTNSSVGRHKLCPFNQQRVQQEDINLFPFEQVRIYQEDINLYPFGQVNFLRKT